MYNSDMSKCRKYEKRKIINIILENHFEKFKEDKLPRIKSKQMRQHIINVIEKALNCGNIEYGYIKHKCLSCDENTFMDFHVKVKSVRSVGECTQLNGLKSNQRIC